jgi:CheY-like chemotaxis protein
MTAFGNSKDAEDLEDNLVDAFLLKPIKQSSLYDTILGLFSEENSSVPSQNGTVFTDRSLSRDKIKGAYVLLVEDNPINQKVAFELLNSAGVFVDIVSEGEGAIEAILRNDYDAVLMDVQMPGMDGFEATRIIRENDTYRELPIIAMTANAMKGDREKCLRAGMNDYVAKPIDLDRFYSTLKKWIVPREHPELKERSLQKQPGKTPDVSKNSPEIEGINRDEALWRLGGDQRLWESLLIDFIRHHRDTVTKIRDKIDQGDSDTAERLAHTLKGVAGNIGAEEVFEHARNLNDTIREGNLENIARWLDDTESVLRRVCAAIDRTISEDRAAADSAGEGAAGEDTAPSELSAADVELVIGKSDLLHGLLDRNDLEAEDVLEELFEYLRASPYAGEVESIRESVEEFNFIDAKKKLGDLKTRLKMNI